MLSPGDTFGLYRIERVIGRGGMAVVYLAYHQWLNRPVALKILQPRLQQDEEVLARFLVEARAAARLEHPNIVAVHNAGVEDGIHFMAMEYVEGETLADVLARVKGPLPSDFILSVAAQVASALDYAHRRGVVHRDIKPSNILVQENGRVMLTDFGIAHAVGLHAAEKKAAVLGTPEYMSPEQAMGKQVDGRSDVYSLGIVVYHMLTGRPPFRGDDYQTILSAHVNQALPNPRQFNPNLPHEIVQVLERATAKDPDQRYATAGAFAQALRRILRRDTPTPAQTKSKQAAPIWLYVLLGVLLGLAALLTVSWLILRGNAAPPAPPPPQQTPTAENIGPVTTPGPHTPIALAATATPTPTPSPSATPTLTPTSTLTPTPTPALPPRIVYVSDRTGAPQIFIIGEDGSNDTQLTFEGRNEHPFWSPDGAQIYFLSDRGQGVALWSMRPDGSEQTELLKAPGSIGYAISPNNEHVTYLQVSQNGINLFLDGLLWAEIPGQHMTYQWSPNSQYVVLEQDYSKTIGLLSITSSTIIPLTDSAYASWNPTWSPDSNFVAFASTKDGNAGIYTVNIQSQEMRRLTPLNTWSQAPSWSTDGSLIAYITGENGNGGWSLFVSDPLGSNRRWLLAPVFPGAPGIWSHTGDKLAFLISDGDEEIAVIDRDGSGLQQLTSNNARDWDPAWEPR